jgi:hypothetical protein
MINCWSYFTLQAGMYAYVCNQRYFAKQYLQQLLAMDVLPDSSLEYKKLKASYYLAQIAWDEGNNVVALQYLNTCAAISQTTSNNKQFFIIVMKELAELYNSFNNQQSAAECYRAIVALREEFPYNATAACIDLKQISTKNTTQPVATSFQSNDTDHGVLKI